MEKLKRWERVMYKKQAYPPNYVSEQFLCGIQDNVLSSFTLRELSPKMLLAMQHMSTMLIMAHLYLMIKDDQVPLLYVEGGTMLAIGVLCLLMYVNKATRIDHYRNVRLAFVVFATVKLLQPVLQTLTISFSCDTVYALAVILSIINIMTHDYDLGGKDDGYVRYMDVLPMNCLVLVSILIASRFGSPEKASAYLQLYMVTFSLLPMHQRYLMNCQSELPLYISTLAVAVITCCCLYSRHVALVPAYIVGSLFIIVVNPLIYIYAQRFKRNVSGPWNPDQVPRNRKIESPDD